MVTNGEVNDWEAVGKAALAGGITGAILSVTGGLYYQLIFKSRNKKYWCIEKRGKEYDL